jgi:hypothetical protein
MVFGKCFIGTAGKMKKILNSGFLQRVFQSFAALADCAVLWLPAGCSQLTIRNPPLCHPNKTPAV